MALNSVINGETSFAQAVESGAIAVSGSRPKAAELFSLMVTFDPWFNIVTP